MPVNTGISKRWSYKNVPRSSPWISFRTHSLNIVLCEKGRPTELIPKLRGVLTNPNCEFYPNFVAIHTLATWCKATADEGPRDVEMGQCERLT